MPIEQWEDVARRLGEAGLAAAQNRPMAPLTTYGVGGAAACSVAVSSRSDIEALASVVASIGNVPVAVVGRGSNLLVADSGFDGLAILFGPPSEASAMVIDGDDVISSAATLMPVLARRSASAGRHGLEWCVGVPGSVGGAVRMNAGGHGAEIVDNLVSVEMVSLKSGASVTVGVGDLGLHFRGSALAAHHVVLEARFRTSACDVADAVAEIDAVVKWRREHQPGGRNAGSVFVNPSPGDGSAGALIDAAGLRGYAHGGARVSEKHANFIQAGDGSTATDVIEVMTHVQRVVREETGITLRSEVQLLGFPDDIATRFSDPRHDSVERLHAAAVLGRIMREPS